MIFLSNYGWPASENYVFWNSIFFTICSTFLLSIILFFLLSRYPQAIKEQKARKALISKHQNFKLSCIDIFVVISGANQQVNYKELLEIEKFRDFFNASKTPDQNYWSGVANYLSRSPYYFKLLNKHIEGLRDEIEKVLGSYDILNEKDREQLEILSHHLRIIQTDDVDYDSIKSFCRSMWSIFTSWDWAEGYPKNDRIEKLLSRI